ncbi:hypothetical protein [Geomesophilobacter sediminis]|uniref:Uncharacterized protein n=1 Tax=Geomesophilobacter sediminis TaxID=2798584 RepID=A0A8J7ISH0_9BACT|nr:hypothetical protein [Geomesophilobacter sediminis]MBJ6726244.1 hypothetical protein [Geomesophilobacter sediminis]
MAERKIIDARFLIAKKKGNGQIRREVWLDDGVVVRYNLAFINHHLFSGDNGRVLGYDKQHGNHHKHYMGQVLPVVFLSFEELEDRFTAEWNMLLETWRNRC